MYKKLIIKNNLSKPSTPYESNKTNKNIKNTKNAQFITSSQLKVYRFVAEAQVRFAFQSDKTELGIWMKNEIGNLGPAFIKFGQFLSTRQDLFGKEVTDQLALLQDNINPVDYEDIKTIIEAELKTPIDDIFSKFDTNYIGSASIGQVHRAILKKSGNEVAIKVQKPNITYAIKDNLNTLKNINNILLYFKSTRSTEFEQIINQYEQFLKAELDYRQELNNMILFYNALSDLPVIVPRVYKQLSTKRILVMEYVPAIKITDIDNMTNQKEVCDILVKLFLSQIIVKGIVHNDTQQGNIGVVYDNDYNTTRIVLYDFGNVIKFSKQFKESIGMLTFSLLQKNTNEFVDLLVELDILYVNDMNELLEVKEIFNYLFKYLDGFDTQSFKSAMESNDFQEINSLKINRDFISIIRVFTLLDGTVTKLDPKYSYIDALQPYTSNVWMDRGFLESMVRKDISRIGTYPRTLEKTDMNMMRVQSKISTINKEVKNIQTVQYTQAIMTALLTLMIERLLF